MFPHIRELTSTMTTEFKNPSWPCNQLGKISPAVLLPVSLGVPQKRVRGIAQLRTDELHGTLMGMADGNNTAKVLGSGNPVPCIRLKAKTVHHRVTEEHRSQNLLRIPPCASMSSVVKKVCHALEGHVSAWRHRNPLPLDALVGLPASKILKLLCSAARPQNDNPIHRVPLPDPKRYRQF